MRQDVKKIVQIIPWAANTLQMAEANDSDLLRQYADRQSEAAFTALVQRHINLVYSVAWRYVGNVPDA